MKSKTKQLAARISTGIVAILASITVILVVKHISSPSVPESETELGRFETLSKFNMFDSGNIYGSIIKDRVTGECYLNSKFRLANAPCPKETELTKQLNRELDK